jgi:hypothetical protein
MPYAEMHNEKSAQIENAETQIQANLLRAKLER